jgi:hypothetical protein
MLYRAIRHQQPMLIVKVISTPPRTLERVSDKVHILGMNSLQYQIGCRFRPGCVPIDPRRFLRPKYPLGTYFHSDTADAAEDLRIR